VAAVTLFNTAVSSEQGTEQLAIEFVHTVLQSELRPIVVYLQGDLGAGKSVFARAMLRSLGVRGAIKSPTYTIIEQYTALSNEHGRVHAAHLDLYRLADAEELYFIGLDDVLVQCQLLLIEWPEKGAGQLPAATHEVTLAYTPDNGRRIMALAL